MKLSEIYSDERKYTSTTGPGTDTNLTHFNYGDYQFEIGIETIHRNKVLDKNRKDAPGRGLAVSGFHVSVHKGSDQYSFMFTESPIFDRTLTVEELMQPDSQLVTTVCEAMYIPSDDLENEQKRSFYESDIKPLLDDKCLEIATGILQAIGRGVKKSAASRT